MWYREWQLVAAVVTSSVVVILLLLYRHLSSQRTWESASVTDQLQEQLKAASEAAPHVMARLQDMMKGATEPVKETLGVTLQTEDVVIGEDDPSEDEEEEDGVEATGSPSVVSRTAAAIGRAGSGRSSQQR